VIGQGSYGQTIYAATAHALPARGNQAIAALARERHFARGGRANASSMRRTISGFPDRLASSRVDIRPSYWIRGSEPPSRSRVTVLLCPSSIARCSAVTHEQQQALGLAPASKRTS